MRAAIIEATLVFNEHVEAVRSLFGLSPREMQVMLLIIEGFEGNKEIAAKLGIGKATAAKMMEHILEKMEVHSRLRAALIIDRALRSTS